MHENSKVKLTEHFSRSELECRCCGLFLSPPEFVFFLERIRKEFDQPMIIESGQRCAKKNAKVGGALDSAHLKGLAVDVSCDDDSLRSKLVEVALKNGATGIGVYERHIHIDQKKRDTKKLWWGQY